MKIQVQLLSILRGCLPAEANRGRVTVTMPEGATMGDLIVHLGIDTYLGYSPSDVLEKTGWQVIVSGQFGATVDQILHDGDTVLMMPLMAGGC